MLDIKKIIDNENNEFERLLEKGVDNEFINKCISDYKKKNRIIFLMEDKLREKNILSEQIKKAEKIEKEIKIEEVKILNQELSELKIKLDNMVNAFDEQVMYLPNIPSNDVPKGENESENIEILRWGEVDHNKIVKHHWEVGEFLGIFDFKRGAKVSGSRFLYYIGDGARLERALWNFMLDHHMESGFLEVIPPYIVNDGAMYNTGNFPKFEEDAFRIQGEEKSLIPTAEVPLTNFYSNEILDESSLPVNMTALSPAFRKEAGSAGRDTRGLIRMHQFNKVELLKFVHPNESMKELEKLTFQAESILRALKLPYRKILLCTGDTGFSSSKTYDLEVWMAASKEYREISSCSNCTDFQSRRAKIRFRNIDNKTEYVHTLNGSGLAIGRTVAAILEFYQKVDGSVDIPDVLVPYFGKKVIEKGE